MIQNKYLTKERKSMIRDFEVGAVVGLMKAKEIAAGKIKSFFKEENGDTNMISIIIVLVIVVALAAVFRKNIAELVNNFWEQIFKDANEATKTSGTATEF